MIDLRQRHIVISGGTPALAGGISEALCEAGAEVTILDDPPDITPEAITAQLLDIHRIEGMIILPMHYATGFFAESTAVEWDDALRLNYERAVYVSQAVAKHMIERGTRGSITFVSTVAIHQPQMQTAVWGTSLAPLYPLAKMAAVDCGQYGIRVNTVTMGWIDTDWHKTHLGRETDREYVEAGIPLGTIGDVDAVGDVCCFLASPLARYVTGAIIPVDGGYTLTRSEGGSPYPE